MASSGVGVQDEVITEYQKLKIKHAYRCMVLRLTEDYKEITIDKLVEDISFEDFVDSLPADDCRYAVFDVDYSQDDGTSELHKSKLVFFVWCPDTAKVKSKMLYASSKDGLKKKLEGLALEFQGSDKGDLNKQDVVDKLKKVK